jgi:hypothetical protein
LDLGISELYVRDKDIGLLRGGVEEQEAVMNGSHTINICHGYDARILQVSVC